MGDISLWKISMGGRMVPRIIKMSWCCWNQIQSSVLGVHYVDCSQSVLIFLIRLRFLLCVSFVRRTLSVRSLSVSQIRIKLSLMLVFPFVRISARINRNEGWQEFAEHVERCALSILHVYPDLLHWSSYHASANGVSVIVRKPDGYPITLCHMGKWIC